MFPARAFWPRTRSSTLDQITEQGPIIVGRVARFSLQDFAGMAKRRMRAIDASCDVSIAAPAADRLREKVRIS